MKNTAVRTTILQAKIQVQNLLNMKLGVLILDHTYITEVRFKMWFEGENESTNADLYIIL